MITKKPLLPVIVITKDDLSTYTFNPHTSVFDFREMNTFLTNVNEGNELIISLGKTNATSTLIFRGIIERKEIKE